MATVTEFIASVRRIVMAPTTQTIGTEDADIVAHGNACMRDYLVPLVMSVREEFYVLEEIRNMVSGQAGTTGRFRIPRRAIGNKLRSVAWDNGSTRYLLPRLEPEQALPYYGKTGTPVAYIIQAGMVVLLPTPIATSNTDGNTPTLGQQLVLQYYCTPGTMTQGEGVAATGCGVVGGGLVISMASEPTLPIHVYSEYEPHTTLATDLTVFEDLGGSVRFYYFGPSTQFIDATRIYWRENHTTSHVQLPTELIPILVHRTAARLCTALGDANGVAINSQAAQELTTGALQMVSQRVEAAPLKIRGGIMAATRWGWY